VHRTDVGDEPKGTGGELPTHQNGAVSVHLATLAMLRRASRLDDAPSRCERPYCGPSA